MAPPQPQRKKESRIMQDAAELERLRYEQGQQFLRQMGEMFAQTRTDLAAQFVPRAEMEHVNAAVERVANAVEKLTNNVATFHENAPRVYADKADTKQELAEIRTEIAKINTAREADKERGYAWQMNGAQQLGQAQVMGAQQLGQAQVKSMDNQTRVLYALVTVFGSGLFGLISALIGKALLH